MSMIVMELYTAIDLLIDFTYQIMQGEEDEAPMIDR